MPVQGKDRKLAVTEPCSEPWEEMFGNDAVRFCSHCVKSVNNVSTMTRREALKLAKRSKGNLCVRYYVDPATGRPVFADRLHQITRRAPAIAAGVIGATMSLSTLAYSQGGVGPGRGERQVPVAERTDDKAEEPKTEGGGEASIFGTVMDLNGAVIPGTKVTLYDGQLKEIASVMTDDAGAYKFERLPDGKYRMNFGHEGFKAAVVENIQLSGRLEHAQMVTLEVDIQEWVVSGGIGVSTVIDIAGDLSKAVYAEDLEQVRDLLGKGHDPNLREPGGRTPLFFAVEDGLTEIARVLLDFGASPDLRDDDNKTALLMIDEETPAELVALLIERGADVNATDDEGYTPLIKAAEDSTAEVVKLLIDAGADISKQDKEDGWTALFHAAFDDDIEKVRMLIEAGSDYRMLDKDGESLLDQVADEELEAFLIAYGVQRTMPNRYTESANNSDDEPEDDDEDTDN